MIKKIVGRECQNRMFKEMYNKDQKETWRDVDVNPELNKEQKRRVWCLIEKYGDVFTARRYASAVLAVIVCLSVCPSVCRSVTSRSSTKMAKPRIRLTTPYDSPETLVSRCQKS